MIFGVPADKMTPEERKKRNEQLYKKAEKKLQEKGFPVYGVLEPELLQMKVDMKSLIQSNNSIAQAVNDIQKKIMDLEQTIGRMINDHIGVVAYLKEKDSGAPERVSLHAQTVEFNKMNLVPKESGIAEEGDTILIRFQLFDGETMVDDQSKNVMAYQLGTHDLSCEDQIVGMKRGESKDMDIVFAKHPKPELIEKILTFRLWIEDVRVKKA